MPTTTNLQTLKINYLTQAQYDTALANNQINDNELYFTPDDGGGGVFVAEYGTTTFSEIQSAYQSGNNIVCRYEYLDGTESVTEYLDLPLESFYSEDEIYDMFKFSGCYDDQISAEKRVVSISVTDQDLWNVTLNQVIDGPDANNKVEQKAAITTNGEYPIILGYSTATTLVTDSVNKSADLTYNPSTSKLTNAGAIECGSIDDGYGLNDSAILSEETMELWGNILS